VSVEKPLLNCKHVFEPLHAGWQLCVKLHFSHLLPKLANRNVYNVFNNLVHSVKECMWHFKKASYCFSSTERYYFS